MKKYAVVVSDYLEAYGASLGVVSIVNTEEEAEAIVENYRNYWTHEGWREYEGNLALMLYNPNVEGEYVNVEIQEIEVEL